MNAQRWITFAFIMVRTFIANYLTSLRVCTIRPQVWDLHTIAPAGVNLPVQYRFARVDTMLRTTTAILPAESSQ